MTIVLIKYKPMYQVIVSGTEVGYIQNKEALQEMVKESVLEQGEKKIKTIH